VGTILASQAF